jgi:uncharacterized protein
MLSVHPETVRGPDYSSPTTARSNCLSEADTRALLDLAQRNAMLALEGKLPLQPMVEHYPTTLQKRGATFVTLRANQKVLSRAGTVHASAPLVSDVCHNAYEVGSHVCIGLPESEQPKSERYAPELTVAVQVVSPVCYLEASSLQDVIGGLEVGLDGVLIQHAGRHATFTPDVWQQWPEPKAFFRALLLKAGLNPQEWPAGLSVATYRLQSLPVAKVIACGLQGRPKAK